MSQKPNTEPQNQPTNPGQQGTQKESDVSQTTHQAPKPAVIPVPGGAVVDPNAAPAKR